MDQIEFAERLEPLKPKLYATAYLYFKNETFALDAVDDAIYQGLLACRKLREPAYFSTWLTRILLNQCHRIYKRHRRELSMDTLPETAVEDFDALPLKDAIASLPEDLRAVVILRYFTGLTLSETAQSLGIPQGTVVTRQRRALVLLKLELTEGEEVPV